MPRLDSRSPRTLAFALGLAVIAAAATVSSAAGSADEARRALAARAVQQPPLPPQRCCFTNPGYTGTCEVVPGKDESCGSILDYLNNPMSQGKGYCSNTTIRGGWKSAYCPSQ